jgi:hypothetical protein
VLEFRDVRIDSHDAAILGTPLAYHHPSPTAPLLHLRRARIAVLGQAFGDPFLHPSFRVFDEAAFGGVPDEALELGSRGEVRLEARIENLAEARVADDEPILGVVADKAFGDALVRLGQTLLALLTGLFCPP